MYRKRLCLRKDITVVHTGSPKFVGSCWQNVGTGSQAIIPAHLVELIEHALLPGDLSAWDGHVAMIVGNGMMIAESVQHSWCLCPPE